MTWDIFCDQTGIAGRDRFLVEKKFGGLELSFNDWHDKLSGVINLSGVQKRVTNTTQMFQKFHKDEMNEKKELFPDPDLVTTMGDKKDTSVKYRKKK